MYLTNLFQKSTRIDTIAQLQVSNEPIPTVNPANTAIERKLLILWKHYCPLKVYFHANWITLNVSHFAYTRQTIVKKTYAAIY